MKTNTMQPTLSQTTEIAVLPVQLEFDVESKCLTINSSFNRKEHQDKVTYYSGDVFDFALSNCLNFLEYEAIQKGVLYEALQITDTGVENKIERDFKALIQDLLASVKDVKENFDGKETKKWKNEAALIMHPNNAGVFVKLDKVDFLSSGIPLLQELMDEQIGSIKDVYLETGAISLVILEENNLPAIIYEEC